MMRHSGRSQQAERSLDIEWMEVGHLERMDSMDCHNDSRSCQS